MAEREAAKAAEEMRHIQEQEEKQKAVMEEFRKPPERTPEQLMQLVTQLVDRAAERGQSEVQIYRFPNSLCTDRGRRINNAEPEWDKLWRAVLSLLTNSGTSIWRRSASISRLRYWSIRAECRETSVSFLPGSFCRRAARILFTNGFSASKAISRVASEGNTIAAMRISGPIVFTPIGLLLSHTGLASCA